VRLTYDPRLNIGYLRLREKTAEVETVRVSEQLNIDMAPDGSIYGIEFLNANAQLRGADGDRVVFVDETVGEERSIPLGG
jgi:uncharacterized protein YuzE